MSENDSLEEQLYDALNVNDVQRVEDLLTKGKQYALIFVQRRRILNNISRWVLSVNVL